MWAWLICKWEENSLIFVKIITFHCNLMRLLQWCYNFIIDFHGNLKNSFSFPFQVSTNDCLTVAGRARASFLCSSLYVMSIRFSLTKKCPFNFFSFSISMKDGNPLCLTSWEQYCSELRRKGWCNTTCVHSPWKFV